MPFSGPNDPELPERIQEMPEDVREKWVGAWNAAFDRCEQEVGEDCEGVAFRIANNAIKDEADNSMIETISNTLYAELAALVDGKPFDGFTHSQGDKFIDMRGQEVGVKKSELATYLKNTLAAIGATRTEDGEVVGLPIDSSNHDHQDAAGFIVDAELVGEVIRLTPKWTELGLEKVGKGLRRMFSAVFNPVRKVIMGGSLTNWPAALDQKSGNVLLRPIELSQGFFMAEKVKSESLKDVTSSEVITTTSGSDGHLVTVASGGELLLPKNIQSLSIESQTETEIGELDMSEDAIRKIVREEMASDMREELTKLKDKAESDAADVESEDSGIEDTMESMLELIGVSNNGQTVEAMRTVLARKGQQLKVQAEREQMLILAQIQREDTIDQFCLAATGGDEKFPVGIPYPADELKAMLMAESFEVAQKWMTVLSAIREKGLTEFIEKGHGKRLTGTATLEAPLAKLLTEWIAKDGSISEFFAVNASELGDMEQYNLSEFKEKVKE